MSGCKCLNLPVVSSNMFCASNSFISFSAIQCNVVPIPFIIMESIEVLNSSNFSLSNFIFLANSRCPKSLGRKYIISSFPVSSLKITFLHSPSFTFNKSLTISGKFSPSNSSLVLNSLSLAFLFIASNLSTITF